MRILLIEDDEMVGEELAGALRAAGLGVDWVRDGVSAEEALAIGSYDAALLDLHLPRRSGLALLRAARARGDRTPILIVTARDGVDDRVVGLDLGADDYLIKPVAAREVVARVRAVVRRRDGHAQSLIGNPPLLLDLATREAVYHGERASLSAREFALLHALLERPGAILSRGQLEQRIYGFTDAVSSNAVDVVIHGLRRRFGGEVILNVRGLGWRTQRGAP